MSDFATETRKEGSRWHFRVERPGVPLDSADLDPKGHPSKAAAEKAASTFAKRAALLIYEDQQRDLATDGPTGWRVRRVDGDGEVVWTSKLYPTRREAESAAKALAS